MRAPSPAGPWPMHCMPSAITPPLPSRDTVLALMRAVDAEQSLEAFEQILGEDPILAYRFMLYTNPRPWACGAMWTRCAAAW